MLRPDLTNVNKSILAALEGDQVRISLPALHDSHTHTSLYISFKNAISFWDVEQKADAMSIIKKQPEDELTQILGWKRLNYNITPKDLEGMPPVVIVGYSLHFCTMSDAAKGIINIDHPEIVENFEDGIWTEKNIVRMIKFYGGLDKITEAAIRDHFGNLSEEGVLELEDMLLINEDACKKIKGSPYGRRVRFWADLEKYNDLQDESIKNDIIGIKTFGDGSLGVQTAAMKKPYPGTDNRGILIFPENKNLSDFMGKVAGLGKKMAIHSIGDRSTEQIIDTVATRKAALDPVPSIRIEHASYINEEYARRAKELGIRLSMQPNFSEDSVNFAKSLPEGYAEKNNPFRMLMDEIGFIPGEDLLFGSDGMPHRMTFALEQSLFPPFPGQQITFDEFIKGYCVQGSPDALVLEIDKTTETVTLVENLLVQ